MRFSGLDLKMRRHSKLDMAALEAALASYLIPVPVLRLSMSVRGAVWRCMATSDTRSEDTYSIQSIAAFLMPGKPFKGGKI